MTTINFGTTVSLEGAATLIRHNKTKRYLLRGEPGIGKSSIMEYFETHFGDNYSYVYFDCINKDLGDIALPSIDRDKRVTEYFLNGVFQHYTGKPMVIMLDEFTKAPQPIQNMLHPLLERRKPRIADFMLPEGSLVFMAGNMTSDGVGDNFKAHTGNRVTVLNVRKPNDDEWLHWAVNHDIDPIVMAWVKQFPHALASYLDGNQDSNPYIFNPKKMQGPFVSPRSLQLVSDSLKNREHFTANDMLADMIGTIGESGARDMHAFVDYQDQLPAWEAVIADPKGAKLPDSPGACAVMVFGAVAKVGKSSIAPFMEYIERMEPEWQAVFAVTLSGNPDKKQVAFTSPKFRDWTLKNVDIL